MAMKKKHSEKGEYKSAAAKRKHEKAEAGKGYHIMPNGKKMKNSAHRGK